VAEEKDKTLGAVVSRQALSIYDGIGRLDTDPKKIQIGINEGRLDVLPNCFWRAIDRYIYGKKEEPKKGGPGPFPGEGGKMAYSNGFVSRMGTKVYEKLINLAANRGFNVCEMPYNALQTEYQSSEPIQGYERLGRYGHEIGIMSHDKDGSLVGDWKKARILAHEVIGAMYTRAGQSHESNHDKIDVKANDLIAELAAA
jgi:hypothetical protein